MRSKLFSMILFFAVVVTNFCGIFFFADEVSAVDRPCARSLHSEEGGKTCASKLGDVDLRGNLRKQQERYEGKSGTSKNLQDRSMENVSNIRD